MLKAEVLYILLLVPVRYFFSFYRLISWVSEPQRYVELARWTSAPGRCDRCGHVGRTHAKKGCPVCATNSGCKDLGHK